MQLTPMICVKSMRNHYYILFVYGADTGGSLDWLRPPFGFIFILIMATHFTHWISFRPKIIRLIYKSACKLNVVIWIYIQNKKSIEVSCQSLILTKRIRTVKIEWEYSVANLTSVQVYFSYSCTRIFTNFSEKK